MFGVGSQIQDPKCPLFCPFFLPVARLDTKTQLIKFGGVSYGVGFGALATAATCSFFLFKRTQ